MAVNDETRSAHVATFLEYLEQETDNGPLMDKVRNMMDRQEARLVINFNDLQDHDRELGDNFLNNPTEYLPAWDEALEQAVRRLNPAYGKEEKLAFHVGVEGAFGRHGVTPRELTSKLIHKLVCLDGIVTKTSLVRPKLVKSVHYCEATETFTAREYRDATSFNGLPTNSLYPTRDDQGNPLVTEYGLCEYKNFQTLHIQEMPERAAVGQLPRSVDAILQDDLCDKCKPGDRVQLVGVYMALPGSGNGGTNGVFRTALVCINLKSLGKEVMQPVMTDVDIQRIRELGRSPDCIDTLSRSIAPSIYGHEYIKKGLLLVMLGGLEKNLANGTHLRGDVNMLMVGDPSTAKSQLLRYTMNLAPLAISTSGRGSSGVGLTAAVTTDTETGERKLEAGAMVLADRGVVCIDEFDKMSDADRVAIHEVMEQQTVTIAKADIHTSLNARCSVVAAANPVYGSYDIRRKTSTNIGLPDSLLSRFDLLFIVLDSQELDIDEAIAQRVLRNHQYRPQEGSLQRADPDEIFNKTDDEVQDTDMYEKFNQALHGDLPDSTHLLTLSFLKKYIHYAKSRFKPRLTEDARDAIHRTYAALREAEQQQGNLTLPITPRCLETIIRLSTAHAKARLSGIIEASDVAAATELMHFAIFFGEQDRMVPNAGKDDDDGDDDDNDDGNGDDRLEAARRRAAAKRADKKASQSSQESSQGSKKRKEADGLLRRKPREDGKPSILAPKSKLGKSSQEKREGVFDDELLSDADVEDKEISEEEAEEEELLLTEELSPSKKARTSSPKGKEKKAADPTTMKKLAPSPVKLSPKRMSEFLRLVSTTMERDEAMPVEAVIQAVNQGAVPPFNENECDAALQHMVDEDKIMLHEEEGIQTIYRL